MHRWVLAQHQTGADCLVCGWMVLGGQSVTHQAKQVDDASDMLASVAGNPRWRWGMCLCGFAVAGPRWSLSIDGAPFSRATILSGHYPYIRDMYLVGCGAHVNRRNRLHALYSHPEAQAIIARHNLAPVCPPHGRPHHGQQLEALARRHLVRLQRHTPPASCYACSAWPGC